MIIWYWSVKGGTGTSVVAAATAIRLASDDHDTTLVDLTGDQPALLGLIAGTAPAEPGISDWVAAGDGVAADAIGRLLEDVRPRLRLLRRGTVPLPDSEGDHVRRWNKTDDSTRRRGSTPLPDSDRSSESDGHRLMLALEVLARSGPVVVDAGLDLAEIRSGLKEPFRPVCVLRACYLALSRAQRLAGPYDSLVLVEEPGRALRARDVSAAVGASTVERVPWDPRVARSVDAGTIVSMLPPPLRRFDLPT